MPCLCLLFSYEALTKCRENYSDSFRLSRNIPRCCIYYTYTMQLSNSIIMMYVIATLSVYPHRASLKNMPGHGGIRTYDLWNASPMLCQLSYAVRSVRVCDISELSLVPSIPMSFSSPEPFSLLAVTRGKIGSGIND